jgi:hypothetical protein
LTSLQGSIALDARSGLVVLTLLVATSFAFGSHSAPFPQADISADRASVPVSFVANRGQAAAPVRYYATAPGVSTFFTRDKVVMSLNGSHALELRFVGSSPDPRIVAGERRPGRVNYFSGSETHTGIPTFGQIAYRDLWPGIDLVFHSRHGALKYEFRLAAGADPADIRLAFAGADAVAIRNGGDLAVHTPAGTLVDTAPRSYQAGGAQVASRFAPLGRHSYGFAVGAYDRTRPLVIDPTLEYSTFLGGSEYDRVDGVAVDGSGSAYVVGMTRSPDFPTTPGAFDRSINAFSDVFVTKLSPDGTSAEYSTFVGGGESTALTGIAVDALGHAYVTGTTRSGFPTTPGAFDSGDHGWDAFLTKLSPDGSSLVYSARLGGNDGLTYGVATAVDADGNAYLAGHTNSSKFHTSPGAFDRTLGGDYDPFVSKLSADGSTLVYSTFVGTSQYDILEDVAIDANGSAYITGSTAGADFPTTPGAFDTVWDGAQDAFVTKLNPSGTALEYSGLLGGSGGLSIEVDGAGSAYVSGSTWNGDFPTTPGAFDRTYGGDLDAFVTKVAPSGAALEFSTFLGGGSTEYGFGIAIDSLGRALVTGNTSSEQFPVTPDAFDQTNTGLDDAFVTAFDPNGLALVYSTFLGGSTRDGFFFGEAAWDASGGAYVSGNTGSQDFPTTAGAFDTSLGGFDDGFVAKFDLGPGPPARLDLSPETATNTLDEGGHCVTATVSDAAGDPNEGVTVSFAVSGTTSASGTASTNEEGEAGFCYDAPELPGADEITASVSPSGPSDTATKTWIAPESTDGCRIAGGGRIVTGDHGRATFSFSPPVRTTGRANGRVRYRGHGRTGRITVTSTEIHAAVCEPGRATIFGGAGLLGFRVDVQDGGRAGGQDAFRILLTSGYDSGVRTLTGGNILVRD